MKREQTLFSEWYHELENFALRSERFHTEMLLLEQSDNLTYKVKILRNWLEGAFEAGYQSGVNDMVEEYPDD